MGMGLPLHNGYYAVDRQTLVNQVIGCPYRTAAWTFVTSQAAYAGGNFWRDGSNCVKIETGELVFSLRYVAKKLGMARATLKKALVELVRMGLIKLRTLKMGAIVRVAKQIFAAAQRPRGSSGDHKGSRDFTKSYKNQEVRGTASGRPEMGISATKAYLRDLEVSSPAGCIPEAAKAFLSQIKGVLKPQPGKIGQ